MRGTRAAFLPSTGDPFILLHCIKYFEEVWQDEVDKLYVAICTSVDRSTIFNIFDIIKKNPKISVIYVDHQLPHGDVIDVILSQCSEEYVMLIEDDAIIYDTGIVNRYFMQLESGEFDVIGSERSSCTPNIIELAARRWGCNFSGAGDLGPGYWPCYLWTKTEYLRATDRIFRNHGFNAGEEIFPGIAFKEEARGDTFMWTSLQLREKGLKILNVPQHHCHPMDYNGTVTPYGALWPRAKFFHMGSLSSGIQSSLLDENGIALADLNNASATPSKISIPNTTDEKLELERRVAWWRQSYELYKNVLPEDRFTRGYAYAIQHLIITCSLSTERLDRWTNIYKGIIDAKRTN